MADVWYDLVKLHRSRGRRLVVGLKFKIVLISGSKLLQFDKFDLIVVGYLNIFPGDGVNRKWWLTK